MELEERVRGRIDRFVSPEVLQAVEWLRVRAEVRTEERREWTVQELDEAMEMFLDHLEEDLLADEREARFRAESLATVAVVCYEMRAPYSGNDVKAWERANAGKPRRVGTEAPRRAVVGRGAPVGEQSEL